MEIGLCNNITLLLLFAVAFIFIWLLILSHTKTNESEVHDAAEYHVDHHDRNYHIFRRASGEMTDVTFNDMFELILDELDLELRDTEVARIRGKLVQKGTQEEETNAKD